MVLALVAMLAMSALVIDGGNAFVQQRTTQNGADAAAEAGALVLAQNLTGGGHSDQDVLDAVTASASRTPSRLSSALYTNVDGNSLGITVGSIGSGPPPRGRGGRPGDRHEDVRHVRRRRHRRRSAHRHAPRPRPSPGPSEGCAISQGCTLLPITFPVSPTVCDGTGNQIIVGTPPYPIVDINTRTAGNEAILGISKTANGSVGWLDIQPPLSSCGNGVPGLICEINNPDYSLTFPIWLNTKTGNVNSKPVDDAVNAYDGTTVLIPFYDCIKDNVGQLQPGAGMPPAAVHRQREQRLLPHRGRVRLLSRPRVHQRVEPGVQPGAGRTAGRRQRRHGLPQGLVRPAVESGAVGSGPHTPGQAVSVQLVR